MSDIRLDARIPEGSLEQKWDNHRFEMRLVAPNNKRKFEVIVVGTGLAGASAAAGLAPMLVAGARWRRAAVPALIAVAVSALVVPLLFRA